MTLHLFPKDHKFFELFRQDAANLREGALALQELVDHYPEKREDVGKKYERIKTIEHQGDDITHELFTKLRDTFITPLEREDIHALASGLDDVLDCIEGVASRMWTFKLARPTPDVKKLVDVIVKAVEQIFEAVDNLEKLGHVHAFCKQINILEYEADVICREAIADLFEKSETAAELKDLIKLKEIYTRLEVAADRCEDVANVIEEIILKSN
jgi:predicted phosphate transport protein (TIGR00153 family)